ncbi:MAG: hypothetical protein ABSA53_19630 [Streptosporangiaceae bacterium]
MRGRTWPGTARPGVRDGPDARTARERRPALLAVADALPVTVLAVIAGAGSFTHIRGTAAQHGPIAWATAVCMDLRHGCPRTTARQAARTVTRRLSWPTVVLAGGVLLSLVAVSMIERRAARRPPPSSRRQGRRRRRAVRAGTAIPGLGR